MLQRDRSDWPDVLNILARHGRTLDWNHLMNRMGADVPLLAAALQVFSWLAPDLARGLPARVWDGLGCTPPAFDRAACGRAALIDSRDWFIDAVDDVAHDYPEK